LTNDDLQRSIIKSCVYGDFSTERQNVQHIKYHYFQPIPPKSNFHITFYTIITFIFDYTSNLFIISMNLKFKKMNKLLQILI